MHFLRFVLSLLTFLTLVLASSDAVTFERLDRIPDGWTQVGQTPRPGSWIDT